MSSRWFPLTLLCILLCSCSVYQQVKSLELNDRFKYLRIGMEESELVGLMGRPSRVVKQLDQTLYLYIVDERVQDSTEGMRTVVINDGEVIDWRSTVSSDLPLPEL